MWYLVKKQFTVAASVCVLYVCMCVGGHWLKLLFTVTQSQYTLWYFSCYPNPLSDCCHSFSKLALNCHSAVLWFLMTYLQWKPSQKNTPEFFFSLLSCRSAYLHISWNVQAHCTELLSFHSQPGKKESETNNSVVFCSLHVEPNSDLTYCRNIFQI